MFHAQDMIRSMTGYGAARLTNAAGDFSAEIRSVNNRHLDLTVRVARELGFLEPSIRSMVRKHVHRGKVDVFFRWTPAPTAPPFYKINRLLLQHYLDELRELAEGHGIALDLASLLQLPGVVNPTELASETEGLIAGAIEVVTQALAAWDATRCGEGQALCEAIRQHLRRVRECVEAIAREKDALELQIRDKLAERMRTLAATSGIEADPARLELELGLLADKLDITEELVRLRSHLEAFEALLPNSTEEALGKKMDFLTQELSREFNTIGSKVRGITVVQAVIEAKNELEKIREQVQDIE